MLTAVWRAISRITVAVLRKRWLARAPIWLYRARLGFLFGNRLLMLEHTGRNSGLRRYVVLEVVDHPWPTRWIVVSGFGERAQKFRNVCSNPQVRVDVGSRRPAPATATLLDDQAATKALQRYAVAHPRAWAYLRPVLEQTLGARIDQWGSDLPVIALDITNGTNLKRLRSDGGAGPTDGLRTGWLT